MSVYVLTPLAKADIFDIWSFIADGSEEAADQVERAIYDACSFVAEFSSVAIHGPTLRAALFVFGL